jgi:two-component system sensor histidine kinase YesM
MIEGEKNKDAVFMVTQLASLFRISLSRGKNIIPVEQEIRHAENYMNIQKVRYKNNFKVSFDIQEEVKKFATVKLIVQPILENAIYYGVGDMDPDDDGEIRIIARFVPEAIDSAAVNLAENISKKPDQINAVNSGRIVEAGIEHDISLGDIYIEVRDNGFGMPPEVLKNLLNDSEEAKRAPKHGSGVGLVNVHKRIKLRFGEQYGLKVESEPDEGTCITIHLPAVPFNEENQKLLESGHYKSLRKKGNGYKS